jgi:hypothetical protein
MPPRIHRKAINAHRIANGLPASDIDANDQHRMPNTIGTNAPGDQSELVPKSVRDILGTISANIE